ncbi:MAG TPA: HI0074 family nucleotidyltransferase substrate-binding subunit [Kiritimatiellia bacterium]|nr:HI0074 family nucleotidyltransferase substrate-binding subunit [Kiritimatiellia bacterium]
MKPDRVSELQADFRAALARLEAALAQDTRTSDLVVDGTIQRFEFAFELAWKLMQALLKTQGLEAASPRAAIKEAFRVGWLPDGDGWIDMLEDRNKTSHLYDETAARTIYDKIKRQHIGRLQAWREQAEKTWP